MNKFLDNLRNLETVSDGDNFQLIEVIRDAANNLGENARRMFAIGEVMDELVKMGFHKDECNIITDDGAEIGVDCFVSNQRFNIYDDGIDENVLGFVYLVFTFDVCEMYYKSSKDTPFLRWLDNYKYEDLINKVKQLIGG